MMRSAPAITAPWITDSPMPPRPKTATVEPGSTFAVFSTAPMPVVTPQPRRHTVVERRVLADLRERDLRHHGVRREGRRAHVVMQHPAAVRQPARAVGHQPLPCVARSAPQRFVRRERQNSQLRHSGM